MPHTFLAGLALGNHIRKLSREGDGLCLAVAFWGHGAAKDLGLDTRGKGARILCDLRSGACNPFEIEALLGHGCQVKARDGLHAKIYLSSTAAIVTSANASANGLGLEGDELRDDLAGAPGNEAGVFVDDAPTLTAIRDWFEALWRDPASEIVERDGALLTAAIDEWTRRRSARPVRTLRGEVGLLEAFRADPLIFDDRPFYVTHTAGYGDERANRQARNHIEKTGQIDANDGADGDYAEGGVANWLVQKNEVASRYRPGSWIVEVWTPEPYQWNDPAMKVSAFWRFHKPPYTVPLKGKGLTDKVNLLTHYVKRVLLSGNVRLILKEEDKDVLVRGIMSNPDGVVPLKDVLQAGLRRRGG